MAGYDDVVESVLVEEEQAVEQAESGGGNANESARAKYLSVYITIISLVVAVAALVTAFAADKWMEETLDDVADSVDYFTLRVEKRCHEIQRDLTILAGRPIDEHFKAEMQQTAHDLAAVKQNRALADHNAAATNRAHYLLAIGITLLQIATALAAVIGVVHLRQLIYASVTFACCGVLLTIVGVTQFLS